MFISSSLSTIIPPLTLFSDPARGWNEVPCYFQDFCKHISSSFSFPSSSIILHRSLFVCPCLLLESMIQCLHLVCIPINPCHHPRLRQLDLPPSKAMAWSIWLLFLVHVFTVYLHSWMSSKRLNLNASIYQTIWFGIHQLQIQKLDFVFLSEQFPI